MPQVVSRFLLSLGALAFQAQGAAFDVGSLLQVLAQANPGEVRFVEKKYTQLLTAPIETRGSLRFTPPDRLEKITLSPRRERMMVEGDALTLTSGGETRSLSLAEVPVARALVTSLRGTLAGNRSALERYYRLQLEGTYARWWLTLEPIDRDTRALVASIRISGAGSAVREVEIFEVNGDRSELEISDAGKQK